jgi:hypothetical protein
MICVSRTTGIMTGERFIVHQRNVFLLTLLSLFWLTYLWNILNFSRGVLSLRVCPFRFPSASIVFIEVIIFLSSQMLFLFGEISQPKNYGINRLLKLVVDLHLGMV